MLRSRLVRTAAFLLSMPGTDTGSAQVRSITCATPKSGKPAPKGKPETGKAKKGRLPVPPRRASEAAVAELKGRRPLTPPAAAPASPAQAAGLPASIDRTVGKTQAEIDAARASLNAKGKGPDGGRVIKMPAGKAVKKASANLRPDGLRVDSKQAVMLDMVLKAGKDGITEKAICKRLDWKACAVTLRRTCERVGVKLVRKDGKFVASGTPKVEKAK